jgi:DNA-directed RNA polymerase specialized sigma24 family protein
VFRSNKPNTANFRADYATTVDFCDIFINDTKHLYVLAFLLTANHEESEQCFGSTVEEAFKGQAVFKEWVRSWLRRTLIENAIEIVSPASARNGGERDFWSAWQPGTQRECEIDTVTKLAPFERFVFIMSILESYSDWDCSVLLRCSMSKVAQARMRALHGLSDRAALRVPGGADAVLHAAF